MPKAVSRFDRHLSAALAVERLRRRGGERLLIDGDGLGWAGFEWRTRRCGVGALADGSTLSDGSGAAVSG